MTEAHKVPKVIATLARQIYEDKANLFLEKLSEMESNIQQLSSVRSKTSKNFSEEDVLVITYADSLISSDTYPLNVLKDFTRTYLEDIATYIHILPFFPYTSDDGFSISDYRMVNPSFGTWKEINTLSKEIRLAFDLVLNHSSKSHRWFKSFLEQSPPYDSYYLIREKDSDTSQVVRPRTHPLFTPFLQNGGSEVQVWTTFSDDQVDLDFSNPLVLLEFIEIMLFYIRQGASMIRLDAVAYLWKENHTSCIHLEKTHLVIKLIRALIDHYNLNAVILTETNVPHKDNISYYGNGTDEAHMVYNFALPPLVIHSCVFGNAETLKAWASTLPTEQKGRYFLNFLASHDGIGITPGYDWIPKEDIASLEQTILDRGGLISYKAIDQGEIAYEYNINYFSAVADPLLDESQRIDCFLTSQAVMLELAGVPGIYIHSLLGSENWNEGPKINGHNRAINREKLLIEEISRELSDESSRRGKVYQLLKRMIKARKANPCFHPEASQQVVESPKEVFALLRYTENHKVLCLNNMSSKPVSYDTLCSSALDLITQRKVYADQGKITLNPYETLWLQLD